MKRFKIAIVLLLSILFLIIIFGFYISNLEDELLKDIEIATTAISNGDYEKLEIQTEIIQENWENTEVILMYFIRHDHLDCISTSIAKLSSYTLHSNYRDYSTECVNITEMIEHLKLAELFPLLF